MCWKCGRLEDLHKLTGSVLGHTSSPQTETHHFRRSPGTQALTQARPELVTTPQKIGTISDLPNTTALQQAGQAEGPSPLPNAGMLWTRAETKTEADLRNPRHPVNGCGKRSGADPKNVQAWLTGPGYVHHQSRGPWIPFHASKPKPVCQSDQASSPMARPPPRPPPRSYSTRFQIEKCFTGSTPGCSSWNFCSILIRLPPVDSLMRSWKTAENGSPCSALHTTSLVRT